jgi:secretion/DNA translocation related TadE-like protein
MRGDRGAAMVWALALAGVLVIVGGAGLSLGELALAHARAGNAADLAALAGASSPSDPCGAADRVAAANSAALLDCTFDSGDLFVRVGVSSPRLARWLASERLEVTARAGPSE